MKYLLLIVVVIFGCRNENRLPPDIISADKMEVLIWDLLKADEVINQYYRSDSTINPTDSTFKLYNSVLQIHKVSEAEFKESFDYYRSNPEQLKSVIDSLQQRSTLPPQLPRLKKADIL